MTRYHVIGGPHDGEEIMAPGKPAYVVLEVADVLELGDLWDLEPRLARYYRHEWLDHDKAQVVYLHGSVSCWPPEPTQS